MADGVYGCALGEPETCPTGWFCRVSPTSGEPRCFRTDGQEVDATVGDGWVDADGDASSGLCQPGVDYCEGETVWSCTNQGQPGEAFQTCVSPETCQSGRCVNPCSLAEAQHSYIGCDYWPTSTANPVDVAFHGDFGVVVHNANDKIAHVIITLGTTIVEERDVQPGALDTFSLNLTDLATIQGDQSVKGWAYHLTSTMPVTAYQFNPLEYQIGANYSYSNDASLLLPTHILSNNYIIMARQTFGMDSLGSYTFKPGFVAIVGTEDNTTVTVFLSSYTSAGTGIMAGTPGTVQQFSLNQGQVLQLLSALPSSCTGTETSNDDRLYCDMGPAYDLTGTIVESDRPVAVYSGHMCSFVPYDTWAADHLEEMMLPLETWGKDYVVGRTEPQEIDPGDLDEPNVIRIVSGQDSNVIRFNPAQPNVGGQITLNKGQWVEFLTTGDFHVNADFAIMVGQFLVGQQYYSTDPEYHGDPAFSLVVPTEQFRDSYTFLAPGTITYNFVNVTKRVGEGGPTVMLDGVPIPDASFSQPVGSTDYGVARVAISGSHHTITSTEPFGIVVYGFATFSSYSYPGGLDLNYINPVN